MNVIVKKSKLRIIAAVCMVLVCAIVAGCAATGPTTNEQLTTKPTESEQLQVRNYIALKSVSDKLAIVYNDVLILTEYGYHRDLTITCSMDGTAAVCLTNEGALLYIHDGTVEKIADHPVSYNLSASGDVLAFQIDTYTVPEATMEPGLYLYQKQTGQSLQAVSDEEGYVRSYTLSPDGKTLAYVTTASFWQETDGQLFICQDGISTLRMQFNSSPALEVNRVYDLISINNSADVIYMYGVGRVFSVNMEGAVTKLGKTESQPDDRGWSSFFFYNNADHSQLLFVNSYGTYLSTRGQKAAYISKDKMHPAERAYSHFRHDARYKHMSDEEAICVTCDFEDLSQQTMRNHNTFWYRDAQRFWHPNETGEFVQVAAFELSENGYQLDPSGAYVYYLDNERALYVLDLENGGQCTKLADKVRTYCVSNDCSTVYYWSDGLYACSGTEASQAQKVPLELSGISFYFSENKELFVETARGNGAIDLYSISEDGKAKVVLENVILFTQEDCGMIYVRTKDGHYIVRAGELIQLQVKTME